MPKKLERWPVVQCKYCQSIIHLTITRDIDRKKFCSRSCSTQWHFKNNSNYANKNKSHSEITKLKMREIQIKKDKWKGETNPNYQGVISKGKKVSQINKELSSLRMRNGGAVKAKKGNKRQSSLQIRIEKILNELNINFISEYRMHQRKLVDIFIEPNFCIECDGDYWHSLPKQQEKDKEFNLYCKANNYKLLRLSETFIKNNYDNNIKEEILCHLAN